MTFDTHDGGEGIKIKRVKPGGAAYLSGCIDSGDRLLAIDGIKVCVCVCVCVYIYA
jgi:hypothetical protein